MSTWASGRAGGVDDHEPTDLVDEIRDDPHVGRGADDGRRRGERDEPGGGRDEFLVLPGGQLARLDLDLGPAHLRAVAARDPQPGSDVRLVVEP